jgi:GT2 family glycosyltransferase
LSSSADLKIETPSNSINGVDRQLTALLVTVHYKNETSTIELLTSLSKLDRFSEVDVAVVANDSGEEQLLELKEAGEKFRNVELLEPKVNLGYFGAAKFALDRYLSQARVLPDWVIVCNHDVLIEDEEFLDKLFHWDPATVGVIAPRITVPSQAIEQNPFMTERPGRWKQFTMRLYSAHYRLAVAWDWLSRQKRFFNSTNLRQNQLLAKANVGKKPIYAAHGSFLIFSRRFFDAGGYLDDGLFLFGEEIAVGEICRTLGLPIVFDPNLHVLHDEHRSVGGGMSRAIYHYHRQSVQYLFSKYLA